jgi:solute carrier family 25 protein 34/35
VHYAADHSSSLLQHGHKSAAAAFRQIYLQEGIPGLWRGVTGSIPRLVVGSAVQLTTYSQCKALAKRTLHVEEGILLHFSSSMLSGMIVALCMNPFDVLTTR